MSLEYCDICDSPTGNGGRGDGSLFLHCQYSGPVCWCCFGKHLKKCEFCQSEEKGNYWEAEEGKK